MLVCADGVVYRGRWRGDQPTGLGVENYPDGAILRGAAVAFIKRQQLGICHKKIYKTFTQSLAMMQSTLPVRGTVALTLFSRVKSIRANDLTGNTPQASSTLGCFMVSGVFKPDLWVEGWPTGASGGVVGGMAQEWSCYSFAVMHQWSVSHASTVVWPWIAPGSDLSSAFLSESKVTESQSECLV